MHTLLFLEPGHFHATLTLRVPHPAVPDEICVYAVEGPELRDFLTLVERFNRRPTEPTRWRPAVIVDADPLSRLIAERRGDVVVLAGRNGGKAATMRRLHAAGLHVLADKPWLVAPDDLDAVRASLGDWPLCMEIITGRHDVTARLFTRLVADTGVFGEFRGDGEPAIEMASVHHLEKLVDGAPLRRPWWFFDVRVQGSGAVDIPTHLVDLSQWLVDRGAPQAPLQLDEARAWATRVPGDVFRRITGESGFPRALQAAVEGDTLSYLCNAELAYRVGPVAVRASARWELASPPGGGDTHASLARGTRSDIAMEQGPHTGHRRRLAVRPRADADGVGRALAAAVAKMQDEMPGVSMARSDGDAHEVTVPRTLDAGHESHFARVLSDFLTTIDERRWPGALAERTLAKYTLLADAAARTGAGPASPTEDPR